MTRPEEGTAQPTAEEDSGDDTRERTSPAEFALGVVGFLVVLGLLAFLVFQGVVVRETGPQLSVEVTAVTEVTGGFAVHYEVRNDGGQTAEQVQVSGSLHRDGDVVEQAQATVTYVPPGSRQSGALLFGADPAGGRLEVRPTGYVLP